MSMMLGKNEKNANDLVAVAVRRMPKEILRIIKNKRLTELTIRIQTLSQ